MSDSSQTDILFWIEQEPTTMSAEYFMPSDTPVKNPSNLTLNQEGRRRKLRQKRAVSRLRAYSVGMLEDGLGYVSSQLNRSMLPHKSITKFTTVSGEDFLRESSADIINLIQYCDDVKAGRTAAVPDPTLTTKADTNNGDTNGKHDEYIKEAEKSFTQITNDITKKYITLSSSLLKSYETNSYYPTPNAQNASS